MTIPYFPTVDEKRAHFKPGDMLATHLQGLAVAGGYIYIADTDAGAGSECSIQKLSRDAPYTQAAVNDTVLADIDALEGAQGYTHIGGITIVGDFIYAPVSNRAGDPATITKWAIIKVAMSDLSVVDVQAITLTDSGTDPDAAGLTHDPDADDFYLVTFDTDGEFYRVAGENHATESYGTTTRITTTATISNAQDLVLAKSASGEKRLYICRNGPSLDQPILELDGTPDGTWMLGTDTITGSDSTKSIWVAEGLVWYARNTAGGIGVLGPAYSPQKPANADNLNTGHASLADCKFWATMHEGEGATVADVIGGNDGTITNQSTGDGDWGSSPTHLEFNGDDGDAYVIGDAGTALSTGGDLENGWVIEAVLLAENTTALENRGYFALRDTALADSGDRISLVSREDGVDEWSVWRNSGGWVNSGYALKTGQLYHLALAWDGTNKFSFYINGFLVGVVTDTGEPDVTGHYYIGRSRAQTSVPNKEQFEGDIWMVRVHSTGSPTGAQVAAWAREPFAAMLRSRGPYRPTLKRVS